MKTNPKHNLKEKMPLKETLGTETKFCVAQIGNVSLQIWSLRHLQTNVSVADSKLLCDSSDRLPCACAIAIATVRFWPEAALYIFSAPVI